MELIHISSYIREEPIEQKHGRVTLFANAWRNRNTQKVVNVKISLDMDLYLDCLGVSEDENLILSFTTEDCWKSLIKVFDNPNFAFVVERDFELMVETEKEMITLKEF